MADFDKMRKEDVENLKRYFSGWKQTQDSRISNAAESGIMPWLKDKGLAIKSFAQEIPLGMYERRVYGDTTGSDPHAENRSKALMDAMEAVRAGQPIPKSYKNLTY